MIMSTREEKQGGRILSRGRQERRRTVIRSVAPFIARSLAFWQPTWKPAAARDQNGPRAVAAAEGFTSAETRDRLHARAIGHGRWGFSLRPSRIAFVPGRPA